MMKPSWMILGFAIAAAGTVLAKGEAACKEEKPGLASKAKISCADARAKALAKVPGATVKSSEIEEEKGRLVYSFDLKQHGKSGIEEVQIDAVSGEVVSVEHESPKSEAAEKKGER